jgi:ABC-type dipeptide/oligopeptide/nickel transport system permease component
MARYLVRQGLLSLVKLFVFVSIMFFFIQLMMPGDFVDQFSLSCDANCRAQLRAQLGLDLPIWERYLHWLRQLVTLELGESFGGQPIGEILQHTIPPTLLIFFSGTAIAFLIGLWLGKRAAWQGSSILSRLTTLGGITLYTSFPPFMAFLLSYLLTRGRGFRVMGEVGGLGGVAFKGLSYEVWIDAELEPSMVVWYMVLTLMMSAIFLLVINLLLRRLFHRGMPAFLLILLIAGGTVGLWYLIEIAPYAFDMLKISWLAIFTYTVISFGETMIIMESSMTEVLKDEYINTAYAKGLRKATVREKHAARNALLPALSRLVISLPYLLTSVVIIESAVGWPGMGTTMWNALYWQNMPVVMATLMLVGVISLVARLFLDIVIAYSDPRIRYDQKQPSAI